MSEKQLFWGLGTSFFLKKKIDVLVVEKVLVGFPQN